MPILDILDKHLNYLFSLLGYKYFITFTNEFLNQAKSIYYSIGATLHYTTLKSLVAIVNIA